MLHKPKHLYNFGAFTLNVSDRILLHGGREVKLGSTAFDLLLFFAAHPGVLVSRDELKQAVWGNRNLEDNNVDQRINEIRRALAQCDRSAGEYIPNTRGHGWRFVAEVTEDCEARLPEEEALAEAVPLPVSQPPEPTRAPVVRAFPWRGLVPASLVAAAVAFGVLVLASGRGRLAPVPSVLRYRKLTSDGRPKSGPLVTDGRFVYFAILGAANAGSDVPFAAAAVPVSGGDIVSPPAPFDPPFLIWDRARSTGEFLYGRVSPDTRNSATTSWLFDRLNRFVDTRLANDARRCFPTMEGPQTETLVQLR